MAIPIIPLPGTCQAEITFICLSRDTMIQLFIGDEAITNPFPVTTTDNQLTLQPIITANTNPGVTITIQEDSVFPLTCPLVGSQGRLHLLVQVTTTTEITGVISFTDSDEGFQNFSTTQFICNIIPPTPTPKIRKKRVGTFLPFIDISFPSGVTPPEFINFRGTIYGNPTLVRTVGGIDGKGNNIYRYTIAARENKPRKAVLEF